MSSINWWLWERKKVTFSMNHLTQSWSEIMARKPIGASNSDPLHSTLRQTKPQIQLADAQIPKSIAARLPIGWIKNIDRLCISGRTVELIFNGRTRSCYFSRWLLLQLVSVNAIYPSNGQILLNSITTSWSLPSLVSEVRGNSNHLASKRIQLPAGESKWRLRELSQVNFPLQTKQIIFVSVAIAKSDERSASC